MFKRLMHILVFVVGGFITWLRLGVPFKDAVESTIQAEKITWEEDL